MALQVENGSPANAPAANELTSRGFWDANWKRAASDVKVIAERDLEYGRRGSILRLLRGHVPGLDGASVLELGGGGSYRLLAVAKWTGARVTAVDYSELGIEQTRELFERNGCEVEAVYDDFFRWDSRGRRFDVVMHWGVAEHFKDPTGLMKLCANLLAPDGTLFFTMPNMDALGAYFWRRWNPTNWGAHEYHSDQDIDRACEMAALRVCERFHYGPPLLQLTPWERPGVGPAAVTLLRKASGLVGWLWPRAYDHGFRRVSWGRAFVCRHACPSPA